MNALARLPETVQPLVARLGSPFDAERLACLSQLDRILARAGITWTELAGRVDAGPCQAAGREPGGVTKHWRCRVHWIVSHEEWAPSERERNFVHDMRIILQRGDPSAKQGEWIASIVNRLGGHVDA